MRKKEEGRRGRGKVKRRRKECMWRFAEWKTVKNTYNKHTHTCKYSTNQTHANTIIQYAYTQ